MTIGKPFLLQALSPFFFKEKKKKRKKKEQEGGKINKG